MSSCMEEARDYEDEDEDDCEHEWVGFTRGFKQVLGGWSEEGGVRFAAGRTQKQEGQLPSMVIAPH